MSFKRSPETTTTRTSKMTIYVDNYDIKLFTHEGDYEKKKSNKVQFGSLNSDEGCRGKDFLSLLESLEDAHHTHNVKITVEMSDYDRFKDAE